MTKNTTHLKKSWTAGFSIIELMVVVTIIAILSTMGIVSYASTSRNARDGKRKADLEQIRAALVLYRVDTGSYPASITWATMAPLQTYMSGGGIVKDPKPAPYTQYTYTTAGGVTFDLCATLEATATTYCIQNP